MISAYRNGFTLVECLVVVSILTISVAMATPSFVNLFQRAQQRSVIHQLEAAVLLARHIAVVNRAAVRGQLGTRSQGRDNEAADDEYSRNNHLD